MKNFLFLFILLLSLTGCKENNAPSSDDLRKDEVIITGHIRNRDFYPQVKDMTLLLPFYREGQPSYSTLIDEDDTFCFNFRLQGEMCEVAIKPYVNHLYVQPGDSIHLEIDFKDMLHPVITGSGEELNRQLTLYTEGGYYMKDYNIWKEYQTKAEFDSLMAKEYKERLFRYDEYVSKHQPTEDVKRYISQMLKVDYYKALFEHLGQIKYNRIEGIDINSYADKMQEAASLFSGEVTMGVHFELAKKVKRYIDIIHGMPSSVEEAVAPLHDTPLEPYLYTYWISQSLHTLNDPFGFESLKEKFERYITDPYLRGFILQLYQSKKNFKENPKPVSDHILYGLYQDDVKEKKGTQHMKPIYDLLEEHKGKMIYIDFWATWCPPCIAEMQPLKELRLKYSTEDVAFITICTTTSAETHEASLTKHNMRAEGIQHLYAGQWTPEERIKIFNQMNVNSYPYHYIINQEGVIVNYGNIYGPRYPGTAQCLDLWIDKWKKTPKK